MSMATGQFGVGRSPRLFPGQGRQLRRGKGVKELGRGGSDGGGLMRQVADVNTSGFTHLYGTSACSLLTLVLYSLGATQEHTPLERMYPPAWLLVAIVLTSTIVARVWVVIVFPKDSLPRRRGHKGTCHLAVFLGSGKPSAQ